MRQSDFNLILQKFDFHASPRCAVAVSGGVDSMCLMRLLCKWISLEHVKGTLDVITVDHGIREESAQEVQFVKNQAEKLGLSCTIIKLNELDRAPGALMSRARQARYRALDKFCKEQNILHLFVGHHGDDQLETIAMREQRGSNLVGNSGMSAIVNTGHYRIIRPLLSFSKQEIYHYMRENLEVNEWVEDPSNTNIKYERARLRRHNIEVKNNSCRVDFEKKVCEAVAQSLNRVLPIGVIEFNGAPLQNLPKNIVAIILVRAVESLGSKIVSPYKIINYIDLILFNKKKFALGGCLIYSEGGQIIVHSEFRKENNKSQKVYWQYSKNHTMCNIDESNIIDGQIVALHSEENCKNIKDFILQKYNRKYDNSFYSSIPWLYVNGAPHSGWTEAFEYKGFKDIRVNRVFYRSLISEFYSI